MLFRLNQILIVWSPLLKFEGVLTMVVLLLYGNSDNLTVLSLFIQRVSIAVQSFCAHKVALLIYFMVS